MATKRQKERVNCWIAKWRIRLLLVHWSVTVSYSEEDKKGSGDNPLSLYAEIVVDSRYNEARMLLYPNLFKKPIAYQESTILHELLHINTNTLKEALEVMERKAAITARKREDILEGITEYVTKLLYKAYNRNKKLGDYHL